MKPILIVGFFYSSNAGDVLISSMVADMVAQQGRTIIEYDFLTGRRVEEKKDTLLVDNSVMDGNKKCGRDLSTLHKGVGQAVLYKLRRSRRIDLSGLDEDLRQCEYVVFAGGNLIMDTTGSWPLILSDYIRHIEARNIPYRLFAVGVGPIRLNSSRKRFGEIIRKADAVSARGRLSSELAYAISGRKCLQVVDPVLICNNEIFRKEILGNNNQINNGQFIVGIGIIGKPCFKRMGQFKKYCKDIRDLIRRVSSSGLVTNVVLYSTELSDYNTINQIHKSMHSNESIQVKKWSSIEELFNLYKRFSLIISSRMHSLIIAQRLEIPYVGICWQDKLVEYSELTCTVSRMYPFSEIPTIRTSGNCLKELCSGETIRSMREINSIITSKYTETMKEALV